MKNNTKAGTSKAPVDREAVRVLAIEIGAREAARRLGLNPNTVLSWAKRDNWELPNRKGGATKASASAITLQSKPGDVLIATHKELETKTKTGLMQTAAKAATHAAQKPPLDVSNTSQLRDLAQSAARIFSWDKGPHTAVQVNAGFKLTMEQLEEMRALCDSPFKKPAVSEERKNSEH